MTSFYSWHPVLQAFVATLGTWGVTALGAMLVLFTRRVSQKYLDASLGMAAGVMIAPIMPYALAFAAGAMIFVVAEELIPEAQANGNVDLATGGVIIGFAIMMTLDVALG